MPGIRRHRNKALADYSIKYMQDAQDYNAQKMLAPAKKVVEKTDEYYIYDRDDAFRAGDTRRANHAEARLVENQALSVGSYQLRNHALKTLISAEDDAFSDDVVNPREDAIEELADLMLRDMEIEVAKNFFTSTAIQTNLLTLSSNAWDNDTTTSNPIDDMDTAIQGIITSIAKKPTGAFMGKKTFDILKDHPEVLDRVKWSERGVVTEDIMSNVLGLPVGVNHVVNATTDYGVSTTAGFLFDGKVLVYYNKENPSKKNANMGTTFVGLYGDSAPVVKRYREERFDSDVIELNWMYDVKLVHSLSGYLINSAHS